ncbi:MAG: hypothetical protein HY921_12000 [Elusimicrobia bacterium]|nr:hypothetical protein [Elusimicrobiota bacterium]
MPAETDNLKLHELFQEDQRDRERVYDSSEALRDLKRRDLCRKTAALEFVALDQVRTPKDLYHAAVILQHGTDPQDFLMAHRMACMAAIQGHQVGRWLTAAALDRFLMAVGLAQIYGTQFEHSAPDNAYQLKLPIDDSRLLASEKKFFKVPSVIERLSQLNGKIKK